MSSLLARRDVIVVASVSCIYGVGEKSDFEEMVIRLGTGEAFGRERLLARLVEIQYERNDIQFERGHFRVRGDTVEIRPAELEEGIRVEFFGDEIDSIRTFDAETQRQLEVCDSIELCLVEPTGSGEVLESELLVEALPEGTWIGLVEVADGIHVYLQPDGGWGWSNAGLLVGDGASLLVDTLFDLRLTSEMLEAMTSVTASRPIDTVVNTHANGDHCYGNQLVSAPGRRLVTTEAAAVEMSAVPPSLLAALVNSDLGEVTNRYVQEAFGAFDFTGIEVP